MVIYYKSRYIEVNENILVVVYNDKNLKFSEYVYDFGDGSLMVIFDWEVIYYCYLMYGDFFVKVIIFSCCCNEILVVRVIVIV